MHLKRLFAGLAALGLIFAVEALMAHPAQAAPFPSLQGDVGVCDPWTPTYCIRPDASGAVRITGSISASFAAFTPTSATSNTSISVTNGNLATALPAGASQLVQNTGTKTAYVSFSVGAGTATTAAYPILAGQSAGFAIGTATFINTITGGSDTTTLLVSGGAGAPSVTAPAGSLGSIGNTGFGVNAQATNGASNYTFEPAANDNHQVIKNGAGTLYDFDVWSKHSQAMFIRFYDAGTGFNGCNSATGLIWEGEIPANSTPANGAGAVRPFSASGRLFATGLSVCVTGAYGNTDTTAATASVASVNVGYK